MDNGVEVLEEEKEEVEEEDAVFAKGQSIPFRDEDCTDGKWRCLAALAYHFCPERPSQLQLFIDICIIN